MDKIRPKVCSLFKVFEKAFRNTFKEKLEWLVNTFNSPLVLDNNVMGRCGSEAPPFMLISSLLLLNLSKSDARKT